jgi:two-component system response regulator DesR
MTTQEIASLELAPLTPRQRECLELTARGYKAREVGDRLGIARQSVTENLARVRHALGGVTLIEAAVLAAKAGWV